MSHKVRIEVTNIAGRINNMLALETLSQDTKKALSGLLEDILHETGNYGGYQNLRWINGGYSEWELAGKPDFPAKRRYIDDNGAGEWSRVYYLKSD